MYKTLRGFSEVYGFLAPLSIPPRGEFSLCLTNGSDARTIGKLYLAGIKTIYKSYKFLKPVSSRSSIWSMERSNRKETMTWDNQGPHFYSGR